MRCLRHLFGSIVATFVFATGTASWANNEDVRGGANDGTDEITAGVEVYSGGYRGYRNPCSYEVYIENTLLDRIAHSGVMVQRIRGTLYRLYLRTCPGPVESLRWIPEPTRTDLAEDARSELAARFLEAPVVGMAPKPDDGVVKLGEWFWTAGAFEPFSVTAQVVQPGRTHLWATTTATPVTLSFDPGDGREPIVCAGPGRVWEPAFGDEMASECMVTYTHSSSMAPNGETWDAALTITWTVDFESSNGVVRQLADLHTTTSFDHRVKELQAIIVS